MSPSNIIRNITSAFRRPRRKTNKRPHRHTKNTKKQSHKNKQRPNKIYKLSTHLGTLYTPVNGKIPPPPPVPVKKSLQP